jgi:hypothetical protein
VKSERYAQYCSGNLVDKKIKKKKKNKKKEEKEKEEDKKLREAMFVERRNKRKTYCV